jgi:hypothetical protein
MKQKEKTTCKWMQQVATALILAHKYNPRRRRDMERSLKNDVIKRKIIWIYTMKAIIMIMMQNILNRSSIFYLCKVNKDLTSLFISDLGLTVSNHVQDGY